MEATAQTRPDPSFSIRTDDDGDALVIRASGELDLVGAKPFEVEVRRALAGPASAVFVDLGDVSFIDSTGLRALLESAQLSRNNGRRLRILPRVSPAVERLLELSGVAGDLPFD